MMVFMYASVVSFHMLKIYIHHTRLSMTVTFSQLDKSECCGAIIDNRSYAPIFVME